MFAIAGESSTLATVDALERIPPVDVASQDAAWGRSATGALRRAAVAPTGIDTPGALTVVFTPEVNTMPPGLMFRAGQL
jgi:hypothetical protein